jgi:hypothetical protein
MDYLAQEIANLKRKAASADGPDLASASVSSSAAPQRKKYMSKGELERQRKLDEAEDDRKKAEARKQTSRDEQIALAAKLARDPKPKKVRLPPSKARSSYG